MAKHNNTQASRGRRSLSAKQKLIATIAVSSTFLLAEITVAMMTKSMALLADAFHYMNDLLGFAVALGAIMVSERSDSPKYQALECERTQSLGAFFNGVFLLALGVSTFLQSVERFITMEHMHNPQLVLVMGCAGLVVNIISVILLHDHHHHHQHRRHHHHDSRKPCSEQDSVGQSEGGSVSIADIEPDLGMAAVMLHVMSDALNNVGIIIAALVIWLAKHDGRFYADPGVSMGISIMIFLSALPLVKKSAAALLRRSPSETKQLCLNSDGRLDDKSKFSPTRPTTTLSELSVVALRATADMEESQPSNAKK